MNRRPLVLAAAVTAAFVIAVPSARAADDENGADDYRKAFAALPADKATADRLDDWDTARVDDDAAKALIDQLAPALEALHRGSAAKAVDWGWDLSKGMDLKLPELNTMRTMAEAAAFDVRYLVAQKRYDDAVRVADDLFVLGRRSGGDKVTVARLVGLGVQQIATNAVAAGVPEMPADAVKQWADDLTAAPAEPPLSDTAKGETGIATATLKDADPADPKFKDAELPADAGDRAKLAEQAGALWTDLAALGDLKPAEADEAVKAWQGKYKAAPKGAQFLVPKGPGPAVADWKSRETLALYLAGLDVARGGKDAVAATKDPYDGDAPFTYKELPGGFELSSQTPIGGKPVKVTFGPAALK